MAFKLLVIDDSEDDRFFFHRALANSEISADAVYQADGSSGLEAISTKEFDCIFLDYYLPGKNGLELLKEIRHKGVDTPVIMLTGQKDDRTIVHLMHEGANDYLPKRYLNSETLRLSIENTQKVYQIKKEKMRAEEALRLSEAKLAEAQRIARIGNWEFNFLSNSFFFSQEAYNILAYSPDSNAPTFRNFYNKVHPDDRSIIKKCLKDIKHGNDYDITFRIYQSDNTIKYLNAIGNVMYLSNGNTEKVVGTIQDISALKNALNETKKATARRKATSAVFTIGILIFLLSEAILDPFIESFAMGLMIALFFKCGIALLLKFFEGFLGKKMVQFG